MPGEIAEEAAIWPPFHFCLPMSYVCMWSAKSKSHLETWIQISLENVFFISPGSALHKGELETGGMEAEWIT